MEPHRANLWNAIVLILLGAWGYFGAENASPTALNPVAFGVVFALSTPLFRRGNKLVERIVIVLTFLLVIALFMPFQGALERKDTLALIRVTLMILVCLYALAVYLKNFLDARKARQEVA
ncbi:MAG: hypothetical protein KDC44_03205 [Phaeodactylibacter sp.]|nr:hypothetical protein [Phaeodactylibacter sp.]